jgi:hypothetical protein
MMQTAMSFIAKIDTAKMTQLRRLLSILAADPAGNNLVPFGQCPTLHFSSLVIFDRPGLKPTLVWENNFDGDLDSYLALQMGIAPEGLNMIFECCQDYEEPNRLAEFFRGCAVRAGLYHIGAVGRTVQRIKDEAYLRMALQEQLSRIHETSSLSFAQTLRQHIQSDPKLDWALKAEPRQPTLDQILAWVGVVLLILAAVIFLPLVLPIGLVTLFIIRSKETTDFEDHAPVPHDHLTRLLSTEDLNANNHMASVTRVKPGAVRKGVLRLVLAIGNILVRTSNRGKLGGISGIHYAHWSLIDGGQWLMFLTNYTGGWAAYLEDFIESASLSLSALWSNTGGFPKTRWLVFGGAKNGILFKTYARNNQSETLVWYCAYPALTLENINENTLLRNEFAASQQSERTPALWLRLI